MRRWELILVAEWSRIGHKEDVIGFAPFKWMLWLNKRALSDPAKRWSFVDGLKEIKYEIRKVDRS